jgi:hypothetical protein
MNLLLGTPKGWKITLENNSGVCGEKRNSLGYFYHQQTLRYIDRAFFSERNPLWKEREPSKAWSIVFH